MHRNSKLPWVVALTIAIGCGKKSSDELGVATAAEPDASADTSQSSEGMSELLADSGSELDSSAASEAETVDVETADVETADVETADVETADVETADVETDDVETAEQMSNEAGAPLPTIDAVLPSTEIAWDQCEIASSTDVYACETSISCPQASGHAACGSGGNCACTIGDEEYALIVEEFAGVVTCEQIARACMQSQRPEFPNAYSCEPATESDLGDECSLNTVCFDEAPLADGFNAVKSASKGVDCFDQGTGLTVCVCTSYQYVRDSEEVLLSSSTSDACGAAFGLCFDAPDAALGEETCASYEQFQTADRCADTMMCQRPATIDGQDVGVVDINGIECEKRDTNDWACRCARGDEFRQFVVPVEEDGGTPCADAVPTCEAALGVEITSNLVCEVQELVDAAPSSCVASLVCTQSGAAGDLAVFRESRASISCGEVSPGDDQWSCGCNAGAAYATPPGGVTGVAACVDASPTCADYLATKVDESNPPEVVIRDSSQ